MNREVKEFEFMGYAIVIQQSKTDFRTEYEYEIPELDVVGGAYSTAAQAELAARKRIKERRMERRR